MKDNENISFEELLASLNEAVEDNSKQLKDIPKDNELEKTVIMKPVTEKSDGESDGFRERITNTFRKLKNPDVYSAGEDSFARQLKDASDMRETENAEKGIPDAAEELLREATTEFVISEETRRVGSKELKKAFEDRQQAENESAVGNKLKEVLASLAEKTKKSKENVYTGDEYTSVDQNKRFLSAFGRDNNSVLIRMVATVFIALLLFYVDLVPVLNVKLLPSFLMPPEYNVVYTLFQMQLLLFIVLINNKTVGRGFSSLFTGKLTPETVTLVAFVAVILHDVITILTCTKQNTVCLYNSVCALGFIMALAYEFLNLKTRLSAFRIASGKAVKYTSSRIPDGSSEEKVFSDYADEDSADMYCVTKTKFINGVMAKLHSPSKVENYTKYIVLASLAVSVVFALISIKNGGAACFHTFTLSLLLCMPLSVFAAASQPLARAQSILEKNGTALLGYDSVEELASAGVMSFNDSDVFPSAGIKVNNIYIYENNRIDHIIYYASGAFARLGGPLKDVFESADADGAGACADIKFVSVEKNGFTMLADGKLVTVGKSTFLREKGFLTESIESDAVYESKGGRIMYMAYDGHLAAKFYIKYTMDTEFAALLKKADSAGIYIGLRTLDPNIDDSLLATSLNLKKYPVKVVKLKFGEQVSEITESESCPAVSRGARGGSKALLSAMFLSSRIRFLRKLHLLTCALSLIIGIVIMALLLNAGTFGATYALYPILLQILWTVVTAASTHFLLQ